MLQSMGLDVGEWSNEQEVSNVKFENKSLHQLYARGTKETKVEPKIEQKQHSFNNLKPS